MGRKILRTGNSAVVSIPAEALEAVGRALRDEVTVTVDPERGRIVLTPATLPGGRPGFLDQVDRFIERYQPALDALAEAWNVEYLTLEEVYLLHERLIQLTGGSGGLRGPGPLESAVARPQTSLGGEERCPMVAR